MHLGFARLLLIASAVRCLVGCSMQEAASASGDAKSQPATSAPQPSPESDESERRRAKFQSQLLSDLEQLRGSHGTGATEQVSHEAASGTPPKLLIFGGINHEVYLGCLCDGKNPESVFNLGGEYASDSFSASLRNKRAPFGSKHADTSACNVKAMHPPSVVASDGKALGLLTLNPALKRRIAADSVDGWLTRLCQR